MFVIYRQGKGEKILLKINQY